MLTKTTVYKVNHDGRHNATPKRFVELWAEASAKRTRRSMMSVTKYQCYEDIPCQTLVYALTRTVRQFVRSDEIAQARDAWRSGDLWVEIAVSTG